MKKTVIMLLVLMALLGATAAQAYYPTRDGFNIYSSGTVRISGSGINAVAVQSWDGRVIIGGSFSATGSGSTVKNLARINLDGTLDTAFAPAPDGPVNAIAIQPDRSGVYVGGSFSNLGAQVRNGLAHLDPTGTPDGFNPASQPNTVINSIVLQSGGILVGGRFGAMAGKTRNNLATINSDGTVPETFPAGTNGDVLAVLQLSDGTMLAGGSFSQPQGKLARFDASGVYDASFSFTPPATVRSLVQQVDGKILLGGDFTAVPAGGQTLSYLARLNSDGTLDSGFNPGPNGSVTSLALAADGKILVGGSFTLIGSTSRNHFARLNITGTLDYNNDPHNDLNPNTDAVVNAIAVQPDGKFLMAGNFRTVAGGGKPRTRLARYYPTGALDEDYSSLFGPTWGGPGGTSDFALSMAQLPNGTDVLIGALGPIDGVDLTATGIARLNPDWTLASNPDNVQLSFPLVIPPQPDGKVILPAEGPLVDGYMPSRRLNADGTLDSTYNTQLGPNAGALSMTMLRPGTKLPDGTSLEDGMFYVGGIQLIDDNACFVRVKSDGSIDQSFHAAPELCHNDGEGDYWAVTSIVIQPDNKVVVANEYGEVMRLLTDGSRDTSFPIVTFDGIAHTLVLMPDGQHIWAFGDLTGDFAQIDLTGNVDQPFTLTTIFDAWLPGGNNPGVIWSADLQTDGNFLLGGDFGKINGVIYDHVARLLPTGQVDPSINLGVVGPTNCLPANKVIFVRLQPDGKLIMSGVYNSINGDYSKAGLSRFNYGWATQDLSVSPDGSTVTWLRGGVSPELWRVWIEDSSDGVNWRYLGEATRTAALDGWYLGGLNVFPTKENHYVRARGYVAGELGSAGTLLESVRMFYLEPAQAKPVLTITASPASKTYGVADPVFAYTASGFVNGDTSALLTGSLGRAPGDGVGSYAINQGNLSAGPNYTISFVPANLAITPATLTVAADSKVKSYGQANPAFTYTVSGFVNGDGASVISGSPALATAAVAGSQVGSYPISAGPGTLSAANYTFAYASGSLTVNPVTLTITADNKSKSYGQANPPLTYTASGFVNGDGTSVLSGTPALSTLAAAGSAVGSYPISAAVGSLSAANYNFAFVSGTLAVNPVTLTITADSKSKSYGQANPPLTYTVSGFANGEDVSVLTGTPALSTAAVAGSAVGSYPISVAVGSLSSANYTFAYASGSLTVNPVTLTITADNKSKSYGQANPLLTYTASGFVNGDGVSVLTGTPVLSTAAVAGSPVGNYPISAAAGSLSAANYTFACVGGTLTVNPVTLTITADNKSKSYGQANPPLTYTASGFVNGDGVSVLTGSPALSTAAVAGSAVGSYPISAGPGTLSAVNYTFAYALGSLTVNPVTLTITADNKSKSYGQANPLLTYTASGFVNGDGVSVLTGTPALTTAALAGSPVGGYPISAGPGTLSAANYTFTCLNGTMTVTQATLTVTADSKSKTCGAADPPLTFSINGFVNGDSSALLTGCLSRVAGEGAGSYPLTQGTLSAGPNYSIAFTAAALEIDPAGGPAAQTITFNALRARTYGDADFDPGATASSNLPVSYTSSDPGIAAVVGSKIRVLAPGAAAITASQGGDAQYQAAPSVTQPLTVNPPPWNALGFDGIDNLMRVGDAPQLNFGAKGGFTIEAWLHLDGSQPDGTGIVSKGEGGSAWSGYQLLLQQNRIAAEIGSGSASLGAPEGLIGTSNLNDGQWHHVALTVDRTQQRADLYLDGRLEAEVTNAALGGTPDNTDPLQAGVDRSGTHFFKGGMDELRLWDTARSKDDLRAAQSQIIDPLNEQHLVAYFHFDEGDVGQDNASFATAPERTAYGATGTLQGFALSGSDSNWVRSGAFLPLLETAPVSVVDTQTASGGGTVYPNYYPPTDTGLCWGASPNPGLSDSCLHAGSGVGPFAGGMGGLAPGTTYHVRGFATNQMGTAFGNDLSFQTARLSQTIVGGIPAKTYGDPSFYPNCSATSGLPVSYMSANPAVAVVVNGQLQITGAGSATITVSQGGNATYQPAAVTFTLIVAKAQLLVVADDKGRAYQTPNPPFTVSYRGFVNGESAAQLSGSAVLTTSATPSSPVGDYDIVVALGTLAAQNYALIPLNGTLSIFKSCQQIIFPAISDLTYGDPPLPLTASTCSGLTISFTSSNPQVGQVNGGTLTITGAGSVVITASQQGSGSLDKAPDVSQTVTVHKSGQLISFPSLPGKLLGDPPFTLGATASSGLAVSYQSSDPAVATVNGSQLTLTGAGTAVITATQGGTPNYNAANPVSQPLTVAIEGNPPLLTLSTLPSGAVTADPVLNVAGTASDPSGLAGVEVNGSELAGQGALFSSAVPLTAGENNVSVSARDVFGNKATQTVSVTFDATAPAIILSAPADNSVTDQPIIAVSGTVSAGSAVRLAVNGGAPQDVAVTDGSFTATGSLVDGLNTVLVSAELAGRLSQVKRSVLLAAGKPYVAITDPAEDLRTEQQSLTLKGVAGSQVSDVSLVLEVNGNTLTPSLQSGSFQQLIPLDQAGPTSITATVTDGSGATSVARRNVIKVTKILGDLNGDGLVDLRDALAALRISLGLDPVTPEALAHGDVAPLVNGVPQPDGKIDVGDVLVILRKVVGLVDF